jgi:hypothetical protein
MYHRGVRSVLTSVVIYFIAFDIYSSDGWNVHIQNNNDMLEIILVSVISMNSLLPNIRLRNGPRACIIRLTDLCLTIRLRLYKGMDVFLPCREWMSICDVIVFRCASSTIKCSCAAS